MSRPNLVQGELIDVCAVARDSVERVRAEGARPVLQLQSPSTPLLAFVNRAGLSQLLDELVVDALRATPEGGEGRLKLFESAGEIGLSVSSVSERSAARVSGLGGRVERTDSDEVVVRLPVLPSPDGKAPEVLVIDDSRSAAWTLALLLQGHGCITQVAHGGPEALDRLQQFKPTIALVDIEMPVMDGFEVVRRIRADEALSSMTIVAVSGHSDARTRERSKEAGFDEFLVKPLKPAQLMSLIAEALTRSARP